MKSKSIKVSYEEYMSDPQILDIRSEIARCRVLAEEFRQSIKVENTETRHQFLESTRMILSEDPNRSEMELDEIMETVELNYDLIFQPVLRMNPKQVQALAGVYKATADIAAIYKKMTEALKVEVEYSPQVLAYIVNFCKIVLPFIPPDSRPILNESLRKFLPDYNSQLALGEVVDV